MWLGLFVAIFQESAPGADSRRAPVAAKTWNSFVETNFPFFSSALDARELGAGWPDDNLTPRGLILNLGHDCWACFDTDLLRMSAIWSGSKAGVSPVSMSQGSYHTAGVKAPAGQENLPQLLGTPWLANGIYPGWQAGEQWSLLDPREPTPDAKEIGRGPIARQLGRFKAVRLTPSGVRLEYRIAGVAVQESIHARVDGGRAVIQRRFELDRTPKTLWLLLGKRPTNSMEKLSMTLASWSAGLRPGTVTEQARAGSETGAPVKNVELIEERDGLWLAKISPSPQPMGFSIAMSLGGTSSTWETPSDAAVSPKARWPEVLTTRAELSSAKDAHVVDNIPLPLNNPWRRNVRLADIAFFKDGRAAAVTFDGDVWSISGLKGDLQNVRWRRFASGLHEPLNIVVRDGEIFVLDRNGIWRLRDTDGNGEADVHELFSNAFAQTAETREFVTGMKLAPDGAFIISKGGQQSTTIGRHNGMVLRVSPDGSSSTVLGWGLRMPFIGVHPRTGMVTASDQQGHYIPTTPLHIIESNRYYGFIALILPKEKYPSPIADPLTWIPHPINASGAAQTWLVGAKMGPLNDSMIHFGYYRPEIFRVLLNERGIRPQAAVVSLTRDLAFPPLSGMANPADGQLYAIGFQIWGTEAKQISGLARIRYTGAASTLPREVVAMDKGVLLRFDTELSARHATNPANFSAERWNYKRTASYGSPHYKLDGSKGQEAMTPSSAYLSRDGKGVFIGISDMRTVMQMRLGWALADRTGTSFTHNVYFTPYEFSGFDPLAEGFAPLTVDLTQRVALAAIKTPITIEEGKRVAELMGCVACHSIDGTTLGKVGPSWKGLFGSQRVFADKSRAMADEDYLRESIKEPAARVVTGFDKSDTGMPSYEGVITDAQIEALVLYLRSVR